MNSSASDVLRSYKQTGGDLEGGSSFLFKCVMASPRLWNPVSHPHQIMHTHAPKTRKKKTEKNKSYKCKMFISLWTFLNNPFSVWWEDWGVYCTDISFKTVTEDVSGFNMTIKPYGCQRDGIQSPVRNMVHGICSSDLQKNLLQRIFHKCMEHSLSVISYYAESSATCVSLSLS